MKSIKNFIIDSKKEIIKENIIINNLQKEIKEYETLICVIGQTGTIEQVNYYKEKIEKCYNEIDIALEKIKNSRDRIATMKTISKIIKRGEKCV